MNAKELLIKAKAKIEDRNNWTQGYMATDTIGRNLQPSSIYACRWCAMGAMYSFVPPGHDITMRARYALNEAAKTLSSCMNMTATCYNDHGTHTQVMQMFDLAISRLEDESYQPHLF